MRLKVIVSVLLVLYLDSNLQAQSDSIVLPAIVIDALPLRFAEPGTYVEQRDTQLNSVVSFNSIADLLSLQSRLYIKTYGLGGLATSSLRGAAASQTSVVWNGMVLQSPMSGLIDLSRLPVGLVDDVSVFYGSSGASWGSGAIGGMIALQTKTPDIQGTHGSFQTMIGSWGTRYIQSSVGIRQKRFAFSSRLISSSGNNNFKTPTGYNSNAASKNLGYLQEFSWIPNKLNSISFNLWIQNDDRQIPPTSVQTMSNAYQNDAAVRSTLSWRRIKKSQILQVRSGYFSERINFNDPATFLFATNKFNTIHSEIEYFQTILKNIQVQTNIQNSNRNADSDNYQDKITENIFSIYSGFKLITNRITGQLSFRKEWQDKNEIPLVPSLGFNINLTEGLKGRLKCTRYYRLPTINDRYWRPGGNINLLPESGWGQEVGLTWELGPNYKWTSNIYHRFIKNWILWSVQQGNLFWSSNNIAAVRSMGIEQRIDWYFYFSKLIINTQCSYDLASSINVIPVLKPKIEAGEQLIYVPKHQGSVQIGISSDNWNILYRHRYTGKVKGINENLKSYQLGWLRISYTTNRGIRNRKLVTNLFFQIDNIWNEDYRIIERRYMPGRNVQSGINIKI